MLEALSEVLLHLVVFLGDPGGDALTVVAAVGAAGAVSAAALHQEAAGPEDGVRPRQLLTQRHGEVARRAAVQPDVLPQQIEIDSPLKDSRGGRVSWETIRGFFHSRVCKMSYLWLFYSG